MLIDGWPQGALSPRLWRPDWSCSICGSRIFQWQPANWDHVVPMSLGGRRGKSNKAPAHQLCNSVKGNRHPFSLRTPAERVAVRELVTPRVYAKLLRLWSGEFA